MASGKTHETLHQFFLVSAGAVRRLSCAPTLTIGEILVPM